MRNLVKIVASLAVSSAAVAHADIYVSTNNIHEVAGSALAWGSYLTEDGQYHDAYTNLQQAVDAAAKDETVWVEDGFVCGEENGSVVFKVSGGVPSYGRILIPRAMTVRSRSGKWETGAVIRGRWQCDYDGTGTAATGPNAIRGVKGPGRSAKLMGFRIERCSMNGFQDGNGAFNIALENCLVAGCSAGYNTLNTVDLRQCVVSNCYASTYAQLFQNGNAYDCLFINNSGSLHAAYLNDGNVVSNCVFTGNAGNCVAMVNGSEINPARVLDCVFTNNTGISIGSQYGAKFRCVVSNCLFTANSGTPFAPMNGLSSGRTNNAVRAYNCVITNNTTKLNVIASCGHFYNCLIANNTCSDTKASVVFNPDVTTPLYLLNCTIYGNRSPNGVGGVSGDGTVVAINTIARENESKKDLFDVFTATTNCCLAAEASAGEGRDNTREAPRLIDPARGVYSPGELSPCYAGGSLTAYPLTPTDLAGRSRLTDGKVAIGAYAYDPAKNYLSVDATFPKHLTEPAEVALTVNVAGLGFSPLFCWDYDGDGVTDEFSTSADNRHSFSAGTWNVRLVVSNLVEGVSAAVTVPEFTVGERGIRYVKVGNAGAAEPYDTEEKAAADIQTAVDYAGPGDAVVILPGTYEIDSAVKVFKEIEVRGSTGRAEDVVVRQTAGDRCLWVDGDDGTIVHSITVENGRRDSTFDYGGGVYLAHGDAAKPGAGYTPTAAKGCISNLVVRNCSNSSKFSCAPGVYACGEQAFVTHCIVSNCTSTSCFVDGGVFSGLGLHILNGASAENCLITANWSGAPYNGIVSDLPLTNGWRDANFHSAVFVGDGAEMRFCTVAGNRTSYCGGVNVCGTGRVKNCVIAGNKALCQFLKDHSEGDRLDVWSAFPASPAFNFFRGPSATEEQRAGCWESFMGIVQAEIAAASEKTGQLAVNAIDVAGTGLADGTVVATPDELFVSAEKGDWRLRANSPARDVAAPASVEILSTGDLLGNPRLNHGFYDLGCYESVFRGFQVFIR